MNEKKKITIRHKAKVLSIQEVEQQRSKAYDYIDLVKKVVFD